MQGLHILSLPSSTRVVCDNTFPNAILGAIVHTCSAHISTCTTLLDELFHAMKLRWEFLNIILRSQCMWMYVYSFNLHFSHLSPVNPSGHSHFIARAQHNPPFRQLISEQTGRTVEKGERQWKLEAWRTVYVYIIYRLTATLLQQYWEYVYANHTCARTVSNTVYCECTMCNLCSLTRIISLIPWNIL